MIFNAIQFCLSLVPMLVEILNKTSTYYCRLQSQTILEDFVRRTMCL